jgi:hypothetical protein
VSEQRREGNNGNDRGRGRVGNGVVSFVRYSKGPRSSLCVLDWRFESTDGVLSLEA